MSELKNRLAAGLSKIIDRAGVPIKVAYFTSTIGSVWDDDVTLTQSGTNLWTSGVILTIDATRGSWDSVLVEQGKLIDGDVKLFTHGSLLVTGSELQVRIMVGSPGVEYSTIPEGAIAPEVQGTRIYKKVYLRQVGNCGSLIGE